MSNDVSDIARIRCAQLNPTINAMAGNIAAIEREIVAAIADGIDLLVLPELATCGYAMTRREARKAALPADDPLIRRWNELLVDTATTAVVGFCEDGGDVLYNSAVALVPGLEPIIYRKLHLWDSEKLIFAPGDERPPIIRTPVGLLGVIICYDLEFPELPRSLALGGADLIAVPTNWPLRSKPEGERPQEVIHAMAAAQASAIVIACCDRSGEERGTMWTEGSTVVGTEGWPLGKVGSDGRLDVQVTVSPQRRQISAQNHLFGDRRPALY